VVRGVKGNDRQREGKKIKRERKKIDRRNEGQLKERRKKMK
jgi:hypothetical protein